MTKTAYHFLRSDMRAGHGNEKWKEGQERTYKGTAPIRLCEAGYHSSPTLFDALHYAPGVVACIVEISAPVEQDESKYVSATRKLIKAVNVERELRLFACACAERALQRERDNGREPDEHSWAAITTARKFANGEATVEELAAAYAVATGSANAAASGSAHANAANAANARKAEVEWQRRTFDQIVLPALTGVAV